MKKQYAAVLLVVSLCISCGGISAAAEQDPQSRREEMKAWYSEIAARFDGLTDQQKAKIYKQNDKVVGEIEKLFQAYVDQGVLTQEDAQRMTTYLTEAGSKAREEGRLVGIPRPPMERRKSNGT